MKSQIRHLLAALLLLAPGAVPAQEVGELLVKKGVLAGDQYLAGGTVDVHGKVEGDLTMGALQAGLDGVVTGDLNAAGLNVHVGGIVGDDVRVLGGRVVVQGWVGDALLAGGGEITLSKGTRVGGNAMLAGRRIVDRGDVAGTLDAAGSYVEIDGDVDGIARIRSDDVVIGPKARLRGDLIVRGANPPRIAEGARIAGKVTLEPAVPATARARVVDAARAGLLQVGMLLLAWAWMALAPGMARDAAAIEWRRAGLAEFVGIAALAGLPIAAGLLAITLVGIPVALGVAAAWTLLVLAGYSSSAICLGDWLRARARRGAGAPSLGARLLWTMIALLLLRAGAALPWVGWVVTVGAAAAGAGAVARAARMAHTRARLSRAPPDPAGA